MSRLARASIVSVVLAFAGVAFADDAPDKQTCLKAYDQAQYAKRDKHFRAARTQALVCAQQACGAASAKDCGEWLRDIETAMPTIVLAVRNEKGEDLTHVAVSMDGEKLVDRLDGVAIPVDPGVHAFRFEAEGMPPHSESVTIQEGEKSRVLAVVVRSPQSSTTVAPTTPMTPTPPTETTTRGSIVPGVIVGGAGLAFVAASIVVGVVAKNDLDRLRSSGCAPTCPSSDLDPIQLKAGISDVLLGVGVAGVGVGVLMIVLRPSHKTTLAFRGTSLVLSGSF